MVQYRASSGAHLRDAICHRSPAGPNASRLSRLAMSACSPLQRWMAAPGRTRLFDRPANHARAQFALYRAVQRRRCSCGKLATSFKSTLAPCVCQSAGHPCAVRQVPPDSFIPLRPGVLQTAIHPGSLAEVGARQQQRGVDRTRRSDGPACKRCRPYRLMGT
jgi:hypothetical protein